MGWNSAHNYIFKLSQTCETAVKAVLLLATKSGGEKAGIGEIARYINVANHYKDY